MYFLTFTKNNLLSKQFKKDTTIVTFEKITLTALLTLHKNKRDRVKNGKRLIKRNYNYGK